MCLSDRRLSQIEQIRPFVGCRWFGVNEIREILDVSYPTAKRVMNAIIGRHDVHPVQRVGQGRRRVTRFALPVAVDYFFAAWTTRKTFAKVTPQQFFPWRFGSNTETFCGAIPNRVVMSIVSSIYGDFCGAESPSLSVDTEVGEHVTTEIVRRAFHPVTPPNGKWIRIGITCAEYRHGNPFEDNTFAKCEHWMRWPRDYEGSERYLNARLGL